MYIQSDDRHCEMSTLPCVQADLFAGAVFLQRAFNWNVYAAIVALLVVAALFTIAGRYAIVFNTGVQKR